MKSLSLLLVFLSLALPQIALAGQRLASLDTFFVNAKTGWSAFRNGESLCVARTSDGGAHWATTVLPRLSYGANEAHLAFIDAQRGWLLALSSPATSKMGKALFRTENGGQSWQKIADSQELNTLPSGGLYPDDLTFRNPNDGWIVGEYRGFPDFPLLVTHDGGVTWHYQTFCVPAEFQNGGYGNSRLPIFFASSPVGVLPVEFHNHSNHQNLEALAIYLTRDGGATWTLAPQ